MTFPSASERTFLGLRLPFLGEVKFPGAGEADSVTLDLFFGASVSMIIGFLGDRLFVRLDRRPCEATTSGRNAELAVGIFCGHHA